MAYKIGILTQAYMEKEILEGQFYPKMKEVGVKKEEIVQFDGMVKDYFDKNAKEDSLSYDGTIEVGEKNAGIVVKIPERLPVIRWLNWRLWSVGQLGFDAVVVCDADEYITGDWEKFKQVISQVLDKQEGRPLLGQLKFKDHDGVYPLFNKIHKLCVNPKDMVMKMAHHIYLNRQTGMKLERVGLKQFGGIFPYITVHQDSSLRPDWREVWNCKWQTLNQTREKIALGKFAKRMKKNPDKPVFFDNAIPY